METRLYYLIAADAMLLVHVLFVVFVVLGLLLRTNYTYISIKVL